MARQADPGYREKPMQDHILWVRTGSGELCRTVRPPSPRAATGSGCRYSVGGHVEPAF